MYPKPCSNLSNVVFIGSGIKFEMVFQRMYSIEILQFYVPSVMLCIASACANFVPPELVPGRMGLCVTTFLSTISLFNGAKYVDTGCPNKFGIC